MQDTPTGLSRQVMRWTRYRVMPSRLKPTQPGVEQQLAFMREQIDQLREAVAVLSAPNGVALASGKHLQLTSRRNLMLNAGADADMGVMKRLFIGVGKG